MILEVRHLKLIDAVSRAGSLTKAGDILHLTQSALSHQLVDLEERLGTPLFSRVGKRMLLTPAGQRVLDAAGRILDDLTRTESDVHDLAAGKSGSLRLTTECYTCYHWLPSLMKEFQLEHPLVQVTIDVGATERPLQALLEGSLDLAIVSSKVADRRLTSAPIFDDELLVIVSPHHRLASRAYIEADDFADETLITYSTLESSGFYRGALRPANIRPKQHTQVRLTEAAIELVAAGMGVAVLARWAVEPQLRSGRVVGKPFTRRGYRRQWRAAFLRDSPVAAFIADFLTLARPRCEPLREGRAAPLTGRRLSRRTA